MKKIAFTMYPVTDMTRARNFYEQKLGLQVGACYQDNKWVEYDLPGGGCLALTTMVEEIKPSDTHGGSVAFEVDEIESWVEKLKNMGVTIKLDIFNSPVCKMAVILDSEGNILMLHEVHKK